VRKGERREAKGASELRVGVAAPLEGSAVHPFFRPALLGLGILVLSLLVLGSVFTPAPHPGGDNAGYLALAYSLVEGMGYRELWDPLTPLHTKYPPVFPLLLAGLIAAGATTWTAFKLFVLLSTASAVFFVFSWASARRSAVTAAGIAILTLLSAGWLDASRWILSEPVFLLFTFLALWAVERGEAQGEQAIAKEGRESPGGIPLGGAMARWLAADGWYLVAGGAALLAYLTRSAGLPLVLALLCVLALRRAYRAGALIAIPFTLLSGWWFLRARGGSGDGAYQSEFWMVNPYEPELGAIGWMDLPFRVGKNLWIYLSDVLPAQWWSGSGEVVSLIVGLILVGAALCGCVLQIRSRRVGAAELFLLLYAGIILLWPSVWSGERFLIPLLPILLLLAGEGLWGMGARLGRGRPLLLAAAFLLLTVPALPGWLAMSAAGSECRRLASSGDPIRCHSAGFQEYRSAAIWAGANLPEGAIVLNRKPRIFYLFDGPRGVVYPFTTEPDLLLAEADRVGARYLLFDHLDGISPYYLPPLIEARVHSFCHIAGWRTGGAGAFGTELFGILPPEVRLEGGEMSDLRSCGDDYLELSGEAEPVGGHEIPLLLP